MFTVEAHTIMNTTSRTLGMELRNRTDDHWIQDPTFHITGYTFGASMDVTFNQIEDLQELGRPAVRRADDAQARAVQPPLPGGDEPARSSGPHPRSSPDDRQDQDAAERAFALG